MKRLTVNIYRYGKFAATGLVLAFYPGYTLFQHFFISDHAGSDPIRTNQTWAVAGLSVIFVAGVLLLSFGLLSLVVSKAVFGPDKIRYRTLCKNYEIPYKDILHVTQQRQTVQKTTQSALFSTTRSRYRLITKSKNYDLSSLEFWGLDKEIQKLKENREIK